MQFVRVPPAVAVLLAGAAATLSPAAAPPVHASVAETPAIEWRAWSAELFAEARRESKFVLLDLEAVWCHWCHVMEETTYRDPEVVRLMRARYLAVRVDQDSRPDLANRYEDYGWPATVVFAPDGAEIVKRRGYIPPGPMARMLQGIIDDPSPLASRDAAVETAAASAPVLAADARAALRQQWLDGYDDDKGGWGFSHKFLDWDTVEYALREAARGDAQAGQMARDTLRLQRRLFDPVWGGVYQYSTGGDWNEPHFEKIMQMQAGNLRIYARAYAQWGDPDHLAAALSIHGYLRAFLTSPDGVVYTSQDADVVPGEHSEDYFALDDAGRRARGVPRIDRHIYARGNGWVIAALAQLAAATGEKAYRAEAERAARWVLEHRALPGGGFRHDAPDSAGPYLGDTVAMGRAFLALHQLTQEREWLEHATAAAEFIAANFGRGEQPGYASSGATRAAFPTPRPQFDENVGVARFAVALAAVTGRGSFRGMAERALRWALAPEVTRDRHFYIGGLLLAEEEARTPPWHATIVGPRDDPLARELFGAALRVPDAHKLVEWWDPARGPAPRGEDIFPTDAGPAAYLCASGACSRPFTDAAAWRRKLLDAGRP